MKYKLSIPEPCHEDWNKMIPNEKGRFCDTCAKTIVDFTNVSKLDLVNKIAAGEKFCGRFQESQLNTPLTYHNPLYRKGSTWVLSLAGALALSGATLAQTNQVIVENPLPVILSDDIDTRVDLSIDTIILRSTVIDNVTKETIPFVTVRVKGDSTMSAITDFDGNFELEIECANEEIVLEFSNFSYVTLEVVVNLEKLDLPENIELGISEQNCNFIMGIVILEKEPDTRYLLEQMRKYYH